MSFIAVGIGAAATIYSAHQAGEAADAAQGAANTASGIAYNQYMQEREDTKAARGAGQRAIGRMEDPEFQRDFSMADYQQDPGYQFRLAEGNKALNAAASARGMGHSGATLKSLLKYNQNFATEDYTNAYNRYNNDRTTRFNRLSALAGAGETANQQVGAASRNYAQTAGVNTMAGANAQMAGKMGQANAISGFANNAVNYFQQNNAAKAVSDSPTSKSWF